MKLKELKDHQQWPIIKPLNGCGANRRFSSSLKACGYWSVKGRMGMWLRKKARLLNGIWLISDFHNHPERFVPLWPLAQSAPSLLLAHSYHNIEHWLLNTESWTLIWYLGQPRWRNLGRWRTTWEEEGWEEFLQLFVFSPGVVLPTLKE